MYSSAQNFLNLVEATQANDVDTVHHLMWACKPKDRNSLPFITAARYGSLECLEALKTVSDVTANDAQALKEAAKNGHLDCVKFLWNRSIPHLDSRGAKALIAAACTGQLEIVQYILDQGVDPHYKMSQPLCEAVLHNQYDVVNLLYEISNPDHVLTTLQSRCSNRYSQWQWFEELVTAKKQKTILNNEVLGSSNQSVRRKI